MDQAGIQAKIARGYGIAARKLGVVCTQYRPADPLAPLANPVGTLQAGFDARPSFNYQIPAEYGRAVWYGLFDTTTIAVGDYIVAPQGTFFVAARDPILPTVCVICPRVLEFKRVVGKAADLSFGRQRDYGGNTASNEAAFLAGWPASLLVQGSGERGEAGLPGDSRLAYVEALLPAFPGISIRSGDVFIDDLGRRYSVNGAEVTKLGWRVRGRLDQT